MTLKNLWTAFLTLAVVITLASCDKNESETGATPENIIGRWTLTLDEVTTIEPNGNEEYERYPMTPGELTIEFKEDGTVISTDESGTEAATWSLDGSQLTMNYGEGDYETMTVERCDEQLVLLYEESYTEPEGTFQVIDRMTFDRY